MVGSGQYGISRTVSLTYEQAVEAIKAALADEGFGVLTEIDVKETMRQKLDVEFRQYVILGACNAPLAHQALTDEIDVGLLLPCNVIVYESDGGGAVVAALDPLVQLGVSSNPALGQLAEDARARLERALDALDDGTAT